MQNPIINFPRSLVESCCPRHISLNQNFIKKTQQGTKKVDLFDVIYNLEIPKNSTDCKKKVTLKNYQFLPNKLFFFQPDNSKERSLN